MEPTRDAAERMAKQDVQARFPKASWITRHPTSQPALAAYCKTTNAANMTAGRVVAANAAHAATPTARKTRAHRRAPCASTSRPLPSLPRAFAAVPAEKATLSDALLRPRTRPSARSAGTTAVGTASRNWRLPWGTK